MRKIFPYGMCFVAASCSSPDISNSAGSQGNEVAAETAPTPNYHDVEGSIYIYQAGLSEDDKNAGKATGDLLFYRYAGEKNGKDTIEVLDASESVLGTAECGSPCNIITLKADERPIERIAYNPQSVIGAAFQDVANGLLKAAPPAASQENN